jgi:PKD repeat protein
MKRGLAFAIVITIMLLCSCGSHRNRYAAQNTNLQAIQSELEALSVPEGVSPKLFAQLKNALSSELQRRYPDGKIILTAPTGNRGKVIDLDIVGISPDYSLAWSYVNAGDYGRDGAVGIADITPLAQHFGEAVDDTNRWIDGSRNGIIDISDITAIAQGFGSQVASYRIESGPNVGSLTEAGVVPFEDAVEVSGLLRLDFGIGGISNTVYRVVPLDAAGNPGEPSDPTGLSVSGLSQNSGKPGEWIEILGGGWSQQTAGLKLTFDGGIVPITSAAEDRIGFYVPPLTTGPYEVVIETAFYLSDPIGFTIESPGALPLTQQEFSDIIGDSTNALTNRVHDAVVRLEEYADLGFTPEQGDAISQVLGDINTMMATAAGQLALMPADEAEMMQSLFYESGALAQLQSLAAAGPVRTTSAGGYEMHRALFAADVASFVLTNIQPLISIAEVFWTAASVASGGVAAPGMLFSLAMGVAMSLMDGIIDILMPTDLQSLEVNDRTFRPGQSVALRATGYFSCQENFKSGTYELTTGILVDVIMDSIGIPESDSVRGVVEQAVLDMLAGAGIDIVTDYIGQVFTGDDAPLIENLPVALDMTIYEGGIIGWLSQAFPVVEFTSFIDQLESWGILPDTDPMAVYVVNPNIATYSQYTGLLTGVAEGATTFRIWGVTFHDVDIDLTRWNSLTLAVPFGILSEYGTITIDTNASTAPPNIISVTPSFGLEGQGLSFGAQVEGAEPMTYAWNFGGGATPNTSTEESPTVTLGTIRRYTVRLTVSNEYGEDAYWFTLTVGKAGLLAGWHMVPIEFLVTFLGSTPIILTVEGRPAIVYEALGWLKYVRAEDSIGSAWGAPVPIAEINSYYPISAAIVGGYPAIAYDDETPLSTEPDQDLKYVRANDTLGATWNAPVIIDEDDDTGHGARLVVADGKPCIAYRDYTEYVLKWVRANDSLGDSWGTPMTVYDTQVYETLIGSWLSALIVDGKPAMIFNPIPNNDWIIEIQHASDSAGTSWGIPLSIAQDEEWDNSFYGSAAIVNGNPALCFTATDGVVDKLSYLRSSDAAGTQWGTPITLNGNTHIWSSTLAVVQGRPAIAFVDGYGNLIMYQADDANGLSWPGPSIINKNCDDPVLADIGGYPAVAYENGSTRWLEYGYYLPD